MSGGFLDACVPAAHRDHHIRGLNRVIGEDLRRLGGYIDTDLVHRGHRGGIQRLGRGAARRADFDLPVGQMRFHLRRADGTEDRVLARAVIDASGTWTTPNPLGGEGLPALGETAASDVIDYRVPDLDDPEVRARYAGRHIVIAGSGHSALTAIIALASLAEQEPGTLISWVLRRGDTTNTFGGGDADQLPARGALGQRAKAAVDAGHLRVVTGFRTAAIEPDTSGRHTLVADNGQRLEDVDRVVVLTGFRPDLT